MGSSVKIVRQDHSAVELRAIAAASRDGGQVRRLLALALVLEGHPRAFAAEQTGMDRQSLRDWVHRYNDEGVAGLVSRPHPGRPQALSPVDMEALKALVLAGPDGERDGVVRWRCVDLQKRIAALYQVNVHENTVSRWLRQLGLTRLQPRPFHPKTDGAAQETFKKTSPP